MLVGQARAVARQWVMEEAGAIPGFAGAFVHGSANWLADDAPLPATSDLDVMVVLENGEPPRKPGKFVHRGVLLDAAYLPGAQLGAVVEVLGQYHLAGSFHAASVIADPTGRLTDLQRAVARDYARRAWVRRRCEHARDKVRTGFALREADPDPNQVTAWLFPTGITTHVLLAAGLRNPTVRTRYLAVRELLAEYGEPDCYDDLLRLLGCAAMSQTRAERHLAALAEAFDAAARVIATPFFFAADISEVGRPVAIEGSRELIARRPSGGGLLGGGDVCAVSTGVSSRRAGAVCAVRWRLSGIARRLGDWVVCRSGASVRGDGAFLAVGVEYRGADHGGEPGDRGLIEEPRRVANTVGCWGDARIARAAGLRASAAPACHDPPFTSGGRG